MRRIVTSMAVTAVLLWAPAVASAEESAFVSPTGVLAYGSGAGTVDTVNVADGAAGSHRISETTSPSGELGPGCSLTAPGTATCSGATSLALFTFDLDDTVVIDASLPSGVWGGTGADTLTGGPQTDWLRGEDGADVLDGRGGVDALFGGSGDDLIEARDGLADHVDCGEGDDRATVDAGLDSVFNCEADAVPPVLEPVPPTVEEVVPPKADAPLVALPLSIPQAIALASAVAKVSGDGRAALEMACAATEIAGCRGDVFLDPAPRAKTRAQARMSRRGRYGRSPFVIAAGGKARLRVKLTPEARRALGLPSGKKARASRRGRRVRARVTVVQKGKAATRSVVELRG